MDSWSVRATMNPTANLSAQVSHGFLNSPERLHPEENVRRHAPSSSPAVIRLLGRFGGEQPDALAAAAGSCRHT